MRLNKPARFLIQFSLGPLSPIIYNQPGSPPEGKLPSMSLSSGSAFCVQIPSAKIAITSNLDWQSNLPTVDIFRLLSLPYLILMYSSRVGRQWTPKRCLPGSAPQGFHGKKTVRVCSIWPFLFLQALTLK